MHDLNDNRYLVSQADIHPISGESESKRTVIRGDYRGDPGIVWGVYKIVYGKWSDEGAGVWSIPLAGNAGQDWYFQDIAPQSYTVLDKVGSLEACTKTPGSHFSPTYGHSKKLYIHCTDGGDPSGRIYGPRWGYDFKLGSTKFITFLNLTLKAPARIDPITAKATHIRWKGCKLSYGEHSLLAFRDGMHHMEVINCELSWAANGIYNISTTNDAPSHYRYIGNHIHHIGVRPSTRNRDAHAIGIQGGANGVIEGNRIEHCGSGPLLYAFTKQDLKDCVVRRNFVKDLHQLGGASGYGISTQCMNNSLSEKSGNLFCHNIVTNSPIAYRFQFEKEQKVFNNVAFNCNIGLQVTRDFMGKGPAVSARNNIFYNCGKYYVDWHTAAKDYILDFDYNIYYPAAGQAFFHGGEYSKGKYTKSFSEWQALKEKRSNFDPSSMIAEPGFSNASGIYSQPSDFNCISSSPAIDAGAPVGLLEDFAGNPIVDSPDIGVFEQHRKSSAL